jgi:hypothetical protein
MTASSLATRKEDGRGKENRQEDEDELGEQVSTR